MPKRSKPFLGALLSVLCATLPAAASADADPCTRVDPDAGSYAPWEASAPGYSGGVQVSHEGLVWEALHWTREEPAFSATEWPSEWMLLSTTELKWHPGRVYLEGEEADHGVLRYRAGDRTQGADPAAGGAWTPIDDALCPLDHY